MKNLLLGAFDCYDYSQLQYWVNSFKATGSDADIAVVVGNASKETVEKLGKQGITIIAFEQDGDGNFTKPYNGTPIQTERFFHYWNFLKDRLASYHYVLHTDMKDVVFQTDPFEVIDDLMDEYEEYHVLSTTECITYENEDWGRQNFIDTFGPYLYEQYKLNEIQNVGIIAGDAIYMKDLFLQIFLGSINRPVAICEQAVYNQLIATRPWNMEVANITMGAGLCANLGTVLDPNKMWKYLPLLTEQQPTWDGEELTVGGYELSIVHQYDRVPVLKEYFERKFADVQT